ncbi:MAG: glycosyltransferase family 2 protein [Planctomycetia bacterium]
MPLVSIVITTKNESRNIVACLESVRRQTFQDQEIIVVDNASTDDTKDLARRYTNKVFDHGPERSAQRNFGVAQAAGTYILYLDADMILEPGVVAECVGICEANPRVAGIYIPEQIVGEGFWIDVRAFERSFYDGTVIDAVRFLPKRIFDAIGGFDASMCGPEDWDFNKKVRHVGEVVVSQAKVMHNEGQFDLSRYLAKKAYYAGNFDAYIARWGANDPDIKRQLGPFYRYVGVFIERGKFWRLVRHPILTAGMYWLRFRVGLRYLQVKLARRWNTGL